MRNVICAAACVLSVEFSECCNTSMENISTTQSVCRSTQLAQLDVNSFRNIIRDAISDVLDERQMANNRELFEMAVRVAARAVEREHANQLNVFAIQAQSDIDRLECSHQHEISSLQEQLDETKRQKTKAEQLIALRGLLLQIPVADKSIITERAINIEQLGILERHAKVSELYKKFSVYKELFGRNDLGVVATKQDLTSVKKYIHDTTVRKKPIQPTMIREIRNGFINRHVSFSEMTFLMKKYGMLDIAWNYEGTDIGEVHKSWAYGPEHENIRMFNHFKDIENTYRKNTYNKELALYNSEYDRALHAVFPSESFNRLVDQVNKFFIEGLQDNR